MSKSFNLYLDSLNTRLNRRRFIWFIIFLWVVILLATLLLSFFTASVIGAMATTDGGNNDFILLLIGSLVLILQLIPMVFLYLFTIKYFCQRANDIPIPRRVVMIPLLLPLLFFQIKLTINGQVYALSFLYWLIEYIPVLDYVLLALLLINIVLFIYLVFKRGQEGPNEWGPDPLAEEEEAST